MTFVVGGLLSPPKCRGAAVATWSQFAAAILFASLPLLARAALAVRSAEPLEQTPEVSEVDAIGDPEAPPTAAKVLGDTVWIADWTFDTAGGACTDAGWVKSDNYILNDGSNYWSIDNRLSGVGGISWHAAILSRHNLCWPHDGYGNNWDYSIILKYSGAGATLSFDKVSDSEAGYDYVSVEADSLGLSEVLTNICAHPTATPAALRTEILVGVSGLDPGSHIGPIVLPNFGTGIHEAYIRFTADTGYSDEDGNWLTVHSAGLVVDNIVVTGGTPYSEDFEGVLSSNVTLANTASAVPLCAAPWWRLLPHITDNDKCSENNTCAWLGTDPLRHAFFPDMAFGPGQAVIHNWLDDMLVSPWVTLASTPGAAATILSFRRFAGNNFGSGAIVQGWRVRAKTKVDNTDTPAPGDSVDCVGTWGHANQFNSLGNFTWLTALFNMTTNFTPAAQEIQVSFRNLDFQRPTFSGALPPATLNTGPGPYNDRIRIGRRILTGPAIDVGIDTRTQAQDAFSTVQNASAPGQHFSPDAANRFGTCAFSEAADLANQGVSPRLVTGDSIYLNSVVDARGAGGVATVKFYGAIVAGPHTGKAPAPYTVGGNGFFAVPADSARNSLGVVVANRWFVDLDDTYFRGGDQLEYFWAATDNAGGFASSPAGMTALPASVAAAEIATEGLREVTFLPTINWDPSYLARIAADAHGDLDPTPKELTSSSQSNCILYYQKSNSARRTGPTQRTAFMYTLDRLGYAGHYDVYDVQGYGNTNNQLGGRANVGQCSAYGLVIQDDGRSALGPNVPDGVNLDNEKINQAQWYRDYLAQGVSGLAGTATLWILGENTAFLKASNPLFTVDMGLAGIVNDQLVAVNPNVVGNASFTWAGGGVTSFGGDTFTLQGGCPSVRVYDGASASGAAVATHNYRSSTTTGPGAIVMNKNTALHWNTVWMGFGWFDIRDTGAPGTPELALATKILNGVVPVACQQSPTTGVGGDPTTGGLPAVTALHLNVPNPFNPVTEIRFDLAARGAVALRVFDVGGRQVRALVDETRPAGRYRVSWNGLDDAGARVASGIYILPARDAGVQRLAEDGAAQVIASSRRCEPRQRRWIMKEGSRCSPRQTAATKSGLRWDGARSGCLRASSCRPASLSPHFPLNTRSTRQRSAKWTRSGIWLHLRPRVKRSAIPFGSRTGRSIPPVGRAPTPAGSNTTTT